MPGSATKRDDRMVVAMEAEEPLALLNLFAASAGGHGATFPGGDAHDGAR